MISEIVDVSYVITAALVLLAIAVGAVSVGGPVALRTDVVAPRLRLRW